MRQRIVIVVALSVLLSGCGSFVSDGGKDVGVTPAAIPDGGPANQIALGVTNQSIVDAEQLLRAHRAVLNGSHVRVDLNSQVTDTNGTSRYHSNMTATFSANGTVGYRVFALGDRRIVQWIDDGQILTRQTNANGTVTYHGSRIDEPRHRALQMNLLNRTLSRATDVTVEKLQDPAEPERYLITARTRSRDAMALETTDDTASRFRCIIDTRGTIRNTTIHNQLPQGLQRVTISFTTVNSVPPKPDWVETARKRVDNRTAHTATG